MGELIAAADELEVALTLISGDVFDSWNPPAWAEDLFFELIDGLAAGGRRAVAVIAGNHDSGLRLAAAEPLARRLGIVLAGNVGEPCRGFEGGGDRVRVTPLAAQVVRVEVPGADAPIIAGLLPFLRGPGRARRRSQAARRSPGRRLALRRAPRRGDRRPLRLHGARRRPRADDAPARDRRRLERQRAPPPHRAPRRSRRLGHPRRARLRRARAPPPAASDRRLRVARSLRRLAYRVLVLGGRSDQARRAHRHGPRAPAKIKSVNLGSGRPLSIWTVTSIDEARARAERADAENLSPIVEVRANLGRRLDPEEGAALFDLGRPRSSGAEGAPFLPGVTVVAVRDLHDPSRRELSRATATEPLRALGRRALLRALEEEARLAARRRDVGRARRGAARRLAQRRRSRVTEPRGRGARGGAG